MDRSEECNEPPDRHKEILDILLESDLYLELPLKERHALFRHIVSAYLCAAPPSSGTF